MSGRFDHAFKLLTGDDPRAVLAIVAGIPLEAEVEVTALDREILRPTLLVDNLFHCRSAEEGEYVVHIEACTHYKADVVQRQTAYIGAIAGKYPSLVIRSFLLLLTPDAVPADLPDEVVERRGAIELRYRFDVVRMWEIPGQRILDMNRKDLYPWTPLTNATDEQRERATDRILAARDRELLVRLALLDGLRYDSAEKFARRIQFMTTEEILEDSVFYHMILEKGEARGLVRGREEGVLEGRRETVLRMAAGRFGELPASTTSRVRAASLEELQSYLDRIVTSPSLEALFGV